jgi:hypothetical protein
MKNREATMRNGNKNGLRFGFILALVGDRLG